jgi:hypothetical protein
MPSNYWFDAEQVLRSERIVSTIIDEKRCFMLSTINARLISTLTNSSTRGSQSYLGWSVTAITAMLHCRSATKPQLIDIKFNEGG